MGEESGQRMNPGEYCRDVESYLCRKNDGHLIRIVGPAFEMVCEWAAQQIPLRVVYAAIDRTFARYYSKAGRRRPVRIEFCEADVLEQFDEWRRAVGVRSGPDPEHRQGRRSLKAHVSQVIDRLEDWRDMAGGPTGLSEEVSLVLAELDTIRDAAGTARGEARRRLVTRLSDLERRLIAVLRDAVDPTVGQRLRAEAMKDLEPFRARMPSDAFRQSVESGTGRLLYEHAKLPRIVYDR